MRFHESLDYEEIEDKHAIICFLLSFCAIIAGMVIHGEFSPLQPDLIGEGTASLLFLSALLGIGLTIGSMLQFSRMICLIIEEYFEDFYSTMYGERYRFDVSDIFYNTLANKQFYFTLLSVGYWVSVCMRYSLVLNSEDYLTVDAYFDAYLWTYPKGFVYGIVGYCLFYVFANLCLMALRNVLLFFEEDVMPRDKSPLKTHLYSFCQALSYQIKERVLVTVFGTCVFYVVSNFLFVGSFFQHLLGANLVGVSGFILSYCFFTKKKAEEVEESQTKQPFEMLSEEEILDELNEAVAFPTPLEYTEGTPKQTIQDILEQVNHQIQQIKPYRAFVSQEDVHILFRMVDSELKPMLHHYSHLPTDVQATYDTQLQEQLTLLLAESERIYKMAYSYHENGFKKIHRLIDNRYKAH